MVKAALRSLDTWIRTGDAPPEAPDLEVEVGPTGTAIVRDDDGIALGGIRLPQVEAPVVALTGDAAPGSSVICLLMGSTLPLAPGRLGELYPTADAYLDAFEQAADDAIDAGFVLADDREALLAGADPSAIAG